MSYKHLSTFERGSIEVLYKKGYSIRQIAKQLGRSPATISRELKRCPQEYSGSYAQWQYHKLRANSKPKGKANAQLLGLLEDHLEKSWSPEQIANTVAKGQVSVKTIYNWLYSGRLAKGDLRLLRHKGKRHNPQRKRGYYSVGRSISLRPKDVDDRQIFGHWELDTIWSCKGERSCLATFVERKSRFYTVKRLPDRSAEAMEQAVQQLISVLPQGAFKTATCDRGKEFACHKALEAKNEGLKLYFCHAFCAGERGSNENCNGLLREFFPKGTDFSTVSNEDISHALRLINSRPKKCLGWLSPIDVFLREVLHLA